MLMNPRQHRFAMSGRKIAAQDQHRFNLDQGFKVRSNDVEVRRQVIIGIYPDNDLSDLVELSHSLSPASG